MIGQAGSAFGAWGKPPDGVAWVALALAVLCAFAALARDGQAWGLSAWLREGHDGLSRRRFLVITSFAAAFLSLGYIAFYLRGGPRIIDSTSYFLQGRALSHGALNWPLIEPTAAFRGRFLLFREPHLLSGIFPPGYPLLLALGFKIGAPMVVGPVLAAGIVVATYYLTREIALTFESKEPRHVEAHVEATARFAALLSVVCVALRYHTADTMSHGACALAIALAMVAAFRAVRVRQSWLFAASGLAIGYVATTRMVSAFPIAIGVLMVALGSAKASRVRAVGLLAVGTLPGLLFLLYAQHAATGDALTSTQLAYYAVSDGPAGCFRYGFGQGVGCLIEHGDFVRARLPHGYGLIEAAGTTLRRLWLHTADVLDFELLFFLVLIPVARAVRSHRPSRIVAAVVVLQMLAYAPFYFDGNYPGGGARFFADILPLEHAMVAVALTTRLPVQQVFTRTFAVLSIAALGFAIHGAYGHRALAERDGGRPMYEPDRAREANLDHGLLFFDTDHGFNLAYDPTLSASHGILAVRRRNDDRDRMLYDLLGHPHSHLYRFVPRESGASGPSLVESWVPPPVNGAAYRFEAEAEWPPIAQSGGICQPAFATGTGASQDKVLELVPDGSGEAWAEIELPFPTPAPTEPPPIGFVIEPRVLLRGTGGKGTLLVYTSSDRIEKARWEWSDDPAPEKANSIDLPSRVVTLEGRPVTHTTGRMVLRAQQGTVGLDKTTVKAHR